MEKPRYYFIDDSDTVHLDFSSLGFDYLACPYRFEAVFEFGVWRVRGIVEDTTMHLPEGSQALHYGQQLFEGMKAQRGPDGRVYAFRPLENARRMNLGARYLKGAEVPEELFLRGIEEVTRANLPYVPPHGSGAALYLRPMYLGVGDNIGVKPATKYVFRIFVSPVGPYYQGGFGPEQGKSFMVSRSDRAAPQGTGHIKAGGNYASSFAPGSEAKEAGFVDAIYLDPVDHRYIEEIRPAGKKTHNRYQKHRLGSKIVYRKNAIIEGWTEISTKQGKSHHNEQGECGQRKHQPSTLQTRRSISPVRRSSAASAVNACTTTWSSSRSILTVPGVSVMELA